MKPAFRVPFLPALALGVAACTAFFPPKEKDDGVTRCDNVGDCDALDDSRFDVECVFGMEQDESSPKVCAPVFKEVACKAENYDPGHPLFDKWDEAQSANGVYVACEAGKQGERGCRPHPTDGCADGLVENAYGTCDVADPEFAAVEAQSDYKGIDVEDQFCRSYFCDKNWICDPTSGKCKLCEDGEPPGERGCVEIWVDGAPSSVYTDDVTCEGGLASTEDVDIGPIPGG